MDDLSLSTATDAIRPFGGPRHRVCLVTSVRGRAGLSTRLVQFLTAEMPSLSFTLEPRPGVSAVWVCGYEAGSESARHVRELRERFPRAVLLATGRESFDRWSQEAEQAGADSCQPWPAPYARVELLLGGRPSGLGPRPVVRESLAPVRIPREAEGSQPA